MKFCSSRRVTHDYEHERMGIEKKKEGNCPIQCNTIQEDHFYSFSNPELKEIGSCQKEVSSRKIFHRQFLLGIMRRKDVFNLNLVSISFTTTESLFSA
jgi:hypothetical protein